MIRFPIVLLLLLFVLPAGASADPLAQLEERLRQIDAELETLAHLSLRSDSGSIGYYSKSYYSDAHPEWVEINLGEMQVFDEVVIVPVVRRYSKVEFKADGLPEKLLVRAGTPEDPAGRLIAEIDTDQPRTAPLVIHLPNTQASWIRIEAPRMNQRGADGRYTFQLAEVLVFSGRENIALHRPVTASTASTGHSDAWRPRFLTDGHTPYIMDTARGAKTQAFIRLGAAPPALTMDLEHPQDVSRIHLHAVDQSAMVPQAHFSDFGMPRHLVIEGALNSDFSDARLLLAVHRDSTIDAGPIMMWRFPETRCRYVRITAPTPKPNLRLPPVHRSSLARSIPADRPPLDDDSPIFRIGFAEIELFSNGTNAARGKTVSIANLTAKIWGRQSALTDGSNLYGEIVPLREWMRQLARRHELEKERPRVEAAIARQLGRQKTSLQRMYWITALLTLVIAAGLILFRLIHLRRMQTIKKRIAADLHDELGANLHAIGLCSELAKMELAEAANTPLNQNLDEIRNLAEMTARATRYVSHMLDSSQYHENLVQEMKHTADRFLADLNHEAEFPPEAALEPLPPRKRIDLYLFYKECLTNIIRHSGASEVKTTLSLSGSRLTLCVSDNGIGLNGQVPHSLKRRARLMHAKLKTRSSENGTDVMLKLRAKHRLSRKVKGRKVQCQ
ncbi:histidine kinase [Pontiella sp.]|uniref:histidine kinase n=1 Tax=Pontiella sp. TaxID=2837462 RepID=UPI003566A33D